MALCFAELPVFLTVSAIIRYIGGRSSNNIRPKTVQLLYLLYFPRIIAEHTYLHDTTGLASLYQVYGMENQTKQTQ